MIEVEQLSLFTMLSPVPPAVAVCCMDGSRVDATPAESWMQRLVQGICRDEYQKEAARLDRIGDIVPLLRQMAGIAGFEIIGRIPLRDKATGKEYR